MNAIRAVITRGRAVVALALLELAGAWIVAAAFVRIWTANIARDPRGAAVLFGRGGRGFLDHIRLEPASAVRALGVGLAGLLAWAIVSVLLSGALPSLFVRDPAPTAVGAISRSIRRAGPLLLLGAATALAYASLAAIAAFTSWAGARATAAWVNARSADVAVLSCLAPILVVVLLVSCARDLTVVQLMNGAPSFSKALRSAVAELVARPLGLASEALLATTASLIVLALAAQIVVPVEPERAAIAAFAIIGQKALAIVRVGIRGAWFAHLAPYGRTVIPARIPG